MLPWEKKQTFPALYGPGFVEINVADIDAAFVSKVDTPVRRRVASNLRTFVGYLQKLGVKGELWIDGSFSTMNPNPHDFDVLLVIPRVTLAGMTPENRDELFNLTDQSNKEYVKRRWSCDLYVCEKSNLAVQRQYEISYSKNPEVGDKGIPVIKL
jgi:hypothetical protein